MSDVKRYQMGLNVAEVYAKEIESPSGYWMAYADHARALAEKDRVIERLRGALKACVEVMNEVGDCKRERHQAEAALAQHEQKDV